MKLRTRRDTRNIMISKREEDGKRRMWRDWPLVIQVLTVVVALVVLLLGLSIYSSSNVTANFMVEANNAKVRAIAETMAEGIKDFIDARNAQRRLAKAVSRVEKQHKGKGFEHIFVLDPDLKILAAMASDKAMVGTTYDFTEISKLEEAATITRQDKPAAGAPVLFGKEGKKKLKLGSVVIEYNDSPIMEARNQINLIFLIIFLVAIILIVPFAFFLRKLFTPVAHLGEVAAAVADGNYEAQVELKKGYSDVAMMLKSFKKLLVSIVIYIEFSSASFVRKVRDGKLDPNKSELEQETVGFCDAVSYTDWSQDQTPQELTDNMNTYFESHVRMVEYFEGDIDKFMGDSVMDFYGEGESEEELFARNAIMAKVATQITHSIANRFFRDHLRRKVLRWRFSAATGNVLKGSVGAKKRQRNYTRNGPTVILASRLEKLCEHGGLMIDKFTYMNCGGENFLEAIESKPLVIKGLKDKVRVYKVIALKNPEAIQKIKEALLWLFSDGELIAEVFAKVEFNDDDSATKKQEKVELRRQKEAEYQEFFKSFVIPYVSESELLLPVPLVAGD